MNVSATDKNVFTIVKGMSLIPEGEFTMGSLNGYSEEKPIHAVRLKAFYMDQNLITNCEYKIFCDETKKNYPANPRWPEMLDYFINFPDYPVVNVSWQQAREYAAWVGKRLPTEEEWEYAACGGLDTPLYPWGNDDVDGNKTNYADRNTEYPWRDFRNSSGYRNTSPVGIYEPNGYNLYDMSGNLWEWCEDWFFAYDDTVKDTEAFNDGWGGTKVCRGGCYHSNDFDLRVSRRRQVLGGGPQISVGFRCVRDIENNERTNIEVCSVSVSTEWERHLNDVHVIAQSNVELCMGTGMLAEERAMHIKNIGFTSVEQYVTWETIENSGKGNWNFSVWDEQVSILEKVGLKWVPFLIAGPAYSLPDWYRDSSDFEGLRCLEHNIESKIQSIWDKNFYEYIDRFICNFAKHYRNSNMIEALLLGITGDFGESIFPVWHGNWPTQISGLYHSHAGYWCNDRFATKDFRQKMKLKYQEINNLNKAWNTGYNSFEEVNFPELVVDPVEGFRVDEFTWNGSYPINELCDRIRWLDFIDWYRASMTEYSEFWLKTTRKYFPNTPIYLCTGGDAAPWHGSDFAQQCKIAAKYNGGVRITNEASKFDTNFAITNWVSSAGNFYNAYFSFEPAGIVNEYGVICRIYNAVSAGAKGLHFYEGNLFDDPGKINLFTKNISHYRKGENKKDIGALYPDIPIATENITPAEYLKSFETLRDYTDFKFLDELTINDGILESIKCAVICCGEIYRKETLNKILCWVKRGGLLIGYNIKNISTAENDESYQDILFEPSGGTKSIENGASLFIPVEVKMQREPIRVITGTQTINIPLKETLDYYQKNLFDLMTGFLASKNLSIADGILDKVYEALVDDYLLLLNAGDSTIIRDITLPDFTKKRVSIESNSILKCSI